MSVPSQTGMGVQSSAAEESSALTKVMLFAIVQLAGVIGGAVGVFYVFSSVFMNTNLFTSLPTNPTPAQVATALGPVFQDVTYIIPLALGIEIIGLLLLFLGLRGLGKVDGPRFRVPSVLTALMIVGLLLVAGGAVPLINSIPNLISQAPSSGTPSAAFMNQLSTLIGYLGIILLGGLLSLIGIIGGLILGLWRVGSRYNQTTIKIGAIFEIIPLLNIVAPILIILGASEAKQTVSR